MPNSFYKFSQNDISAKKIFDECYCSKTTKKLGQHFLFNESINRKIVAAAGDLSGKIVAEVGPGPGGLTLEILRQNIEKLYIIEYDSRWANVWTELQPIFQSKLEIIECDALKFNMKNISPNVIISNLPYNISSQLLFKWMPDFELYERLILMFQKEVADRIYAKPCTKSYGKLSVLAQCVSRVSKICDVEPGSFFPPPKVKSTVVEFIPYTSTRGHAFGQNCEQDQRCDFHKFSQMLTSAFMHRRKVVAKSLETYFDEPIDVLSKLGYSQNTRAEEISVNDYVAIFYESSKN